MPIPGLTWHSENVASSCLTERGEGQDSSAVVYGRHRILATALPRSGSGRLKTEAGNTPVELAVAAASINLPGNGVGITRATGIVGGVRLRIHQSEILVVRSRHHLSMMPCG